MEPPCILHPCQMERLWSLALKLQTHSVFFMLNEMVLPLTIIIFSGQHQNTITGHGVWSHDAHVVMQDVSHIKLITMSLLQTCSYITNQMHTQLMLTSSWSLMEGTFTRPLGMQEKMTLLHFIQLQMLFP